MKRFLLSWLASFKKSPKSSRPLTQQRHVRLGVECLERRELMTAAAWQVQAPKVDLMHLSSPGTPVTVDDNHGGTMTIVNKNTITQDNAIFDDSTQDLINAGNDQTVYLKVAFSGAPKTITAGVPFTITATCLLTGSGFGSDTFGPTLTASAYDQNGNLIPLSISPISVTSSVSVGGSSLSATQSLATIEYTVTPPAASTLTNVVGLPATISQLVIVEGVYCTPLVSSYTDSVTEYDYNLGPATPAPAPAPAPKPAPTPGTDVWSGADSTFWNDSKNWSLGRAPINGDSLVFPATAKSFTSDNNVGTLSLASIDFTGANYQMVGLPITLAGTLSQQANGNNTFAIPTTLGGSDTVTVSAGTLNISGELSGQGSLMVQGAGTVVLSHINIYTGGTTLQGATLQIDVGALSSGALTLSGGNLKNGSRVPMVISNPTTMTASTTVVQAPRADWETEFAGGFTVKGNSTLTATDVQFDGTVGGAGQLTIAGDWAGLDNATLNAGLQITGGEKLFIHGTLKGSGAITIAGGDVFNCANLAAFTGSVTLNSGALETNGSLGTGNLVLAGGSFYVVVPAVNLTNTVTLSAPTVINLYGGTLNFHDTVTLSANVTETLVHGTIDFFTVAGNGHVVTVKGEGKVISSSPSVQVEGRVIKED